MKTLESHNGLPHNRPGQLRSQVLQQDILLLRPAVTGGQQCSCKELPAKGAERVHRKKRFLSSFGLFSIRKEDGACTPPQHICLHSISSAALVKPSVTFPTMCVTRGSNHSQGFKEREARGSGTKLSLENSVARLCCCFCSLILAAAGALGTVGALQKGREVSLFLGASDMSISGSLSPSPSF